MSWELFDEKTTVPGLSPGKISLSLSVQQAAFTVKKWYAIKDMTHVLYYLDAQAEQIAIKFIQADQMTTAEALVAYKILDQGYHRISFNCRRFIDSLPFPLVDSPSGKWTMNFEWDSEQNMAIIKRGKHPNDE